MSASERDFEDSAEHGGIPAGRLLVHETSIQSDSDDDGTVEVPPGEERDVVRWDREAPIHLFALGTNDAPDLRFRLVVDEEIIADTASPLGTINSPFSFADNYNGPIEADDMVAIRVENEGNSSRQMAGRLHMEVVG